MPFQCWWFVDIVLSCLTVIEENTDLLFEMLLLVKLQTRCTCRYHSGATFSGGDLDGVSQQVDTTPVVSDVRAVLLRVAVRGAQRSAVFTRPVPTLPQPRRMHRKQDRLLRTSSREDVSLQEMVPGSEAYL